MLFVLRLIHKKLSTSDNTLLKIILSQISSLVNNRSVHDVRATKWSYFYIDLGYCVLTRMILLFQYGSAIFYKIYKSKLHITDRVRGTWELAQNDLKYIL